MYIAAIVSSLVGLIVGLLIGRMRSAQKYEDFVLCLMVKDHVDKKWSGQELADASKGEINRGQAYLYLTRLINKGLVDRCQKNGSDGVYQFWLTVTGRKKAESLLASF